MKRQQTSARKDRLTRVNPPTSARASGSARARHPLLHAFPLTVLTLGAVLIVFAFAMAEFNHDKDSDLRAGNRPSISREALSQTP